MTLRLNGSTSGYTEIDAPAVAGSNTLVLPTGNGSSGQVLSTNGSGALSWAAPGKILQVVSTTKTDTFTSTTTGSWLDITGFSVSITPAFSSSKILITYSLVGGTNGTTRMKVRLVRDSTDIAVGDSAGSRLRATSADNFGDQFEVHNSVFTYLDSPATTSATTYKVQIRNGDSTGTLYVNRNGSDTDNVVTARFASSITVMEVAA